MPPIFDFADHFNREIAIGDQRLPIKVKRFSRAERESFEKRLAQTIRPRGVADLSAAEKEALEADRVRFCDEAIEDAITLEPGLVRASGVDVVDGRGLIGVFHARADVLGTIIAEIYNANRLDGIVAKNSPSPRVSDSGSDPSLPARGGDAQGPTATSAEPSTTAGSEAATASIDDASSGEMRAG